MKILGYTLQNIQSWDEDSGIVPLSTDRMNVIIAPSETGKSVVIKILKEMCFAGKWGYTWSSLIKRGSDWGKAAFLMEDGSAVIYIIWRNKVRYILMPKDENIEPQVWDFSDPNHTEIPEELATHMGLIVDRKSQTVINVLDKDMVTPYVTAPPELNARIASVITVVPEMEKRRESLLEWQNQLKTALQTAEYRMSGARRRYHEAPEIDILSHQIALDNAERYLEFIEPLDNLMGEIKFNTLPEAPQEAKCPDLDDLVECHTIIYSMFDELESLVTLDEPETVKFDEEVLPGIVDITSTINNLSLEYNSYNTALPPVKVNLPGEVNIILELLNSVKEFGESLRELTLMKPPVGVVKEPSEILPSVIAIHNNIGYLSGVYNDMCSVRAPKEPKHMGELKLITTLQKFIDQMPYNNLCQLIKDVDVISNDIQEVALEIEKVKEELKVCPTCDRPWE